MRNHIRYLEDQNLFILPIQTDQGVVYQYHQLFKDFLVDQFQELPPQKQDELNYRVAKLVRKEKRLSEQLSPTTYVRATVNKQPGSWINMPYPYIRLGTKACLKNGTGQSCILMT